MAITTQAVNFVRISQAGFNNLLGNLVTGTQYFIHDAGVIYLATSAGEYETYGSTDSGGLPTIITSVANPTNSSSGSQVIVSLSASLQAQSITIYDAFSGNNVATTVTGSNPYTCSTSSALPALWGVKII